MRSRETFASIIQAGSENTDFFGTAYGYTDGKYDGFKLGAKVAFDDAVLLVEPTAAKHYATMLENEEAARAAAAQPTVMPDLAGLLFPQVHPAAGAGGSGLRKAVDTVARGPIPAATKAARAFRGSVDISPTLAKSELISVVEEVIALLAADPNTVLKLTLEIDAEFPNGASDNTKRNVSENAASLKFKVKDWE